MKLKIWNTPNDLDMSAEIRDENNEPVCDVFRKSSLSPEVIVTACNSHEDLLQALKDLVDCGLQPDEVTLWRARQAIQKAEQK